jgi:Tfp pilus assembly protein PilO
MSQLSPRVLALGVVAIAALVALIGWFALVSPQRSKVHSLDGQIADAKSQLHVASMLASVQRSGSGKKSGLALLRVAMPDNVMMPSVLNEVQRLARSSDVSLNDFTPSVPSPVSGYDTVPIAVQVAGRYAAVERFLRRLRYQAGSRAGRIHASGRLYSVQSVSLTPATATATGDAGLSASIQLAVFTYTGQTLPTATDTTTTTDTSTTSGGA